MSEWELDMARRQMIVIASCGVLVGCSLGSPISNFAFPKMEEMDIPDIHFMGVRLHGEKPGVRPTRTTPYQLSRAENDTVRRAVASRFPGSVEVTFYPLRSGIADDGTVSVCGMVSSRNDEGAEKNRLFRGDLLRQREPGTPSFSVRQISGANAATIEVFGDCQQQGLA
ncbi:hypothetical protein VQ042_16825 [Aurantimonas sp. A2-1-M11]|uniref:hypothetical protein n=1 Tax=Aurantimonas sp. A2-1-M11 TaxID=3113712 RepID=UPI002F95F524